MLGWLWLVALLGATAIAGRWLWRGRDELGRPRAFPWISVSLLVIVAAASGYAAWSHSRLEQRLSTVASVLAERPVTVRCQTFLQTFVDAGAESGRVAVNPDGTPEASTFLKRDVCAQLKGFMEAEGRGDAARFTAVHVLTHEAMHMRGEMGEALAECQAMQRDAVTARLLGADDAVARQLPRTYYSLTYPQMPDDYRSGECRAGGTLDERLPDAPWAAASP